MCTFQSYFTFTITKKACFSAIFSTTTCLTRGLNAQKYYFYHTVLSMTKNFQVTLKMGSLFHSSTAYSSYSPALPATIAADPRFGYTVDLIFDGIINIDMDKTTLPTIILRDEKVLTSPNLSLISPQS